jgi:hypothetical protein
MSFANVRIVKLVVDPREYFTQPVPRGHRDFEMSISALKEFATCASRWQAGYEPPASSSRDYGSLLDTLALNPEEFDRRYVVQPDTYTSTGMECPQCKTVTTSKKCSTCKCERIEVEIKKPWSNQSATCQEWLAERQKQGLEVVWPGDRDKAAAALKRLHQDAIIATFLDCSDKQVWIAAEWTDKATGLTIPVKCMIDAVPRIGTPFYKNIGDLKTSTTADPQRWSRKVFEFRYHWQGAFNLDIYRAARPDEDRCNFCHLIQESFAPYEPGHSIMSEQFLELGRAAYERALSNYCWCLKNNRWPGYDDNDESIQGWSVAQPTPWMESEILFAPKYAADNNAAEELAEDDVMP